MKKLLYALLIALAVLTAVLAAVHLKTRAPEIEGEILINGEYTEISELSMTKVKGTVINGKGEKKEIDADGISLSVLCGDCTEVSVKSSDEYNAVLYADELKNAYLIIDDGAMRLVVFGDENAKRDVKNVAEVSWK